MKSLRESLFDKDLIQKDIAASAVIKILDKYLKSNRRISEDSWRQCLNELSKFINYDSSPKQTIKKRNVNLELNSNKLYLYIHGTHLSFWGEGIIKNEIQYITINWKPDDNGCLIVDIYDLNDGVYGMLVRGNEYVVLGTTFSLNKDLGDLLKNKTVII